jgi:hypothetical protein
MKIRLFAAAMLLSVASLTGATVLVPSQAHAASAQHTGSITATNISGTYTDPVTSTVTTFTDGVLKVTNLAVDPVTRQVTATGTLTSASTGITSTFTAPVSNLAGASCPILALTLGPLNLNLLGLVVSIPNPIVLNITAVPGAGNLLGNLLCAVANLLNGGGLAGLNTLLAQINAILTGLGL